MATDAEKELASRLNLRQLPPAVPSEEEIEAKVRELCDYWKHQAQHPGFGVPDVAREAIRWAIQRTKGEGIEYA